MAASIPPSPIENLKPWFTQLAGFDPTKESLAVQNGQLVKGERKDNPIGIVSRVHRRAAEIQALGALMQKAVEDTEKLKRMICEGPKDLETMRLTLAAGQLLVGHRGKIDNFFAAESWVPRFAQIERSTLNKFSHGQWLVRLVERVWDWAIGFFQRFHLCQDQPTYQAAWGRLDGCKQSVVANLGKFKEWLESLEQRDAGYENYRRSLFRWKHAAGPDPVVAPEIPEDLRTSINLSQEGQWKDYQLYALPFEQSVMLELRYQGELREIGEVSHSVVEADAEEEGAAPGKWVKLELTMLSEEDVDSSEEMIPAKLKKIIHSIKHAVEIHDSIATLSRLGSEVIEVGEGTSIGKRSVMGSGGGMGTPASTGDGASVGKKSAEETPSNSAWDVIKGFRGRFRGDAISPSPPAGSESSFVQVVGGASAAAAGSGSKKTPVRRATRPILTNCLTGGFTGWPNLNNGTLYTRGQIKQISVSDSYQTLLPNLKKLLEQLPPFAEAPQEGEGGSRTEESPEEDTVRVDLNDFVGAPLPEAKIGQGEAFEEKVS